MKKSLVVLAVLILFLVWGLPILAWSGRDVAGVSGPVWLSPLKVGIKNAVEQGVSLETIVLLLLFPLTAALVAFSRQVVGLTGFGIFIPALVSMAFLSTGVLAGIVLFLAIILTALVARFLMTEIKLPYLPRMAVLIWAVVMGVLGLLIASPVLGMERLVSLGIFPVLLFIMLAESNIEAQITRTWQVAAIMTGETMVIAIFASWIMGMREVQNWVLEHPELAVLLILAVDWLVGKYKGLRLLEVYRFRKILKLPRVEKVV